MGSILKGNPCLYLIYQPFEVVERLHGESRLTEPCCIFEALQIISRVLASLSHADSLALVPDQRANMAEEYIELFVEGRRVDYNSFIEIFVDLAEQPRITEGASADHDIIAAGVLVHMPRRLRVADIAVADDGYRQGFFDVADDIEVDRRSVELLSRPAVDGHRLCAVLLGEQSDLDGVDMLVVKAGAYLHGHRNIHSPADRADDPAAELRVAHECCSGTAAGYLGRRTAHVYVDHLGAVLHREPRGVRHRIGLGTEDLHRARSLRVAELHQRGALDRVIGDTLGADHLADAVACAELAAQLAEGSVSHACHRRERGVTAQAHITDLHITHRGEACALRPARPR